MYWFHLTLAVFINHRTFLYFIILFIVIVSLFILINLQLTEQLCKHGLTSLPRRALTQLFQGYVDAHELFCQNRKIV